MRRTLFSLLFIISVVLGSSFEEGAQAIVMFDQPALEKSITSMKDANEALPNGKTLLMLAAYKGNNKAIAYLLLLQGDINAQDNEGRTPLMLSLWNDFDETTLFLLEKGAHVNVHSKDGTTPLRLARLKNNTKMVERLLLYGAKE